MDGTGSTWTNRGRLDVGYLGSGTLNITGGGAVSNGRGYLGHVQGSMGVVTVNGTGSTWTNRGRLDVGYFSGSGLLNITDGGLVSVADWLSIGDRSSLNMAAGRMLATLGDAGDSLADFMDRVAQKNSVRYWNDSVSDWTSIMSATHGKDYSLSYQTEGDLIGYTLLTVVTPGPKTGDFNGDGSVEQGDLDLVLLNWGANWLPTGWVADLPVNFPIGSDELAVVRENWESTVARPANSAVPEPASLGMIMIGLAGAGAWRKWGR